MKIINTTLREHALGQFYHDRRFIGIADAARLNVTSDSLEIAIFRECPSMKDILAVNSGAFSYGFYHDGKFSYNDRI